MIKIEELCRPDSEHYCVECCRGVSCVLLGEVGEGMVGCTGYEGPNRDGLSKRPLCNEVSCSDRFTPEVRAQKVEEAKAIITGMASGEIRMSEVFNKLG